ncbi:DUF6221 family protein [Nocardia sp. NPDC046763]|uniref:DUF6221 family protein n=1 Tax=Nocardia sp. NPDC046763 TaxID=3155256 RepID=UPI0034101E58
MTVEDFIAARLTEREAVANEAIQRERASGSGKFDLEYQWVRFTRGTGETVLSGFAPGAPSPDEVLRQCAAIRAIVAEHDLGTDPCDAHGPRFESVTCGTVRAIASIWSNHPGYQREWSIDAEGSTYE